MKSKLILVALALVTSINAFSQKNNEMKKDQSATLVELEQTKGEFTQKTLTLKEGDYIFEIENNNVGKDVGFVLAPKLDPNAHIKSAYVTQAVKNNSKEKSNITYLKKGEYVYYCPLNETPQYTLIVE
jgi:plastocyanin